jgi:hypothetical protein
MSLSAKAGAHRSTPVFASHSAIGCITDLTSSTEIEHFQTTLDRRSILTVHRSANCHPAVANYVAFNGSMMRELAVEFLSLAGALARRSRGC